ncbi:MAG TPA: multicopper oxidase domain-containing protein [Bryobacteraceae bacterium]|nr:multicopper oxidase domain-containing protein [Bryobacteraceae bacterium]
MVIDSLHVDITGRRSSATAINGTLPGPILHWREGETVTLSVTNRLPQEASIHWHGIRSPAGMDGVPGLSPRAELGTERSATVTMRFYMTVRSPAFDTWTGKRECEPIWIPDLREYGARLASRVLLFIFSILNQPYMSGTADTWFERDHILLTSQWPVSKQGRPRGSHSLGAKPGYLAATRISSSPV